MFTSDPVSGNRRAVTIDASFGLGEALVSGLVNSDNYKCQHLGEELRSMQGSLKIVRKRIGDKRVAIYGNDTEQGGTRTEKLGDAQAAAQAMSDDKILELSRIGLAIQEYYRRVPQDIEWAMEQDGKIYILQSRPITSLYPLPARFSSTNYVGESTGIPESKPLSIYFSFNHQQVMLEPFKPLGMDVINRLVFNGFHTAGKSKLAECYLMRFLPLKFLISHTHTQRWKTLF